MIDFTDRPAAYNDAGPRGEPLESERCGLVLNAEVRVAHRGVLHDARVRGFCIFEKYGACFNYTIVRNSRVYGIEYSFADTSSSFWCRIAEEGIVWCREDADEETIAAMSAAAAMC